MSLFQDRIKYPGYVGVRRCLAAASKNVVAMKTAAFQIDTALMQSFLGTWNLYITFIKGFSSIARPLDHITLAIARTTALTGRTLMLRLLVLLKP